MESPKRLLVVLLTFALCSQQFVVGYPHSDFKTSIRIRGGRDAQPGELPYQLSLRLRESDKHFCGASLTMVNGIQLAVTSAYCIAPVLYFNCSVTMVAGDLNLGDTTGLEQTRDMKTVFIHEEFDLGDANNDLAILFVDPPFELKQGEVEPIMLPNESHETTGNFTVSGWGFTRPFDEGPHPDTLQIVTMSVSDHEECRKKWANFPDEDIKIGDGIFCSGLPYGAQSICIGDNGGPAVSMADGSLTGVVSFGYPHCEPTEYPALFTKVSNYVQWISDKVTRYVMERDD